MAAEGREAWQRAVSEAGCRVAVLRAEGVEEAAVLRLEEWIRARSDTVAGEADILELRDRVEGLRQLLPPHRVGLPDGLAGARGDAMEGSAPVASPRAVPAEGAAPRGVPDQGAAAPEAAPASCSPEPAGSRPWIGGGPQVTTHEMRELDRPVTVNELLSTLQLYKDRGRRREDAEAKQRTMQTLLGHLRSRTQEAEALVRVVPLVPPTVLSGRGALLGQQQQHHQQRQQHQRGQQDGEVVRQQPVREAIVKCEAIDAAKPQAIEKQLVSDDRAVRMSGVVRVRRLLASGGRTATAGWLTAVLPRLVALLQDDTDRQLQFEAAWAMAHFLGGTDEHRRAAVEGGVVPVLVHLAQLPGPLCVDVRSQSVEALGCLLESGSAEFRDVLCSLGALRTLHQLAEGDQDVQVLRATARALHMLFVVRPPLPVEDSKPLVGTLRWLAQHADAEVSRSSCLALSEACADPATIQAVLDTGVAAPLVRLLSHPDQNVRLGALRTVGNLAIGNDRQAQQLVQSNVLPALVQLLLTDDAPREQLKDCCWAMGNVVVGNASAVRQLVFEEGVLPTLLRIVGSYQQQDPDLCCEACWALCNAVLSGSPEVARHMVRAGVVEALVGALDDVHADTQMGILKVVRFLVRESTNEVAVATADRLQACNGVRRLQRIAFETPLVPPNFVATAAMSRDMSASELTTELHRLMELHGVERSSSLVEPPTWKSEEELNAFAAAVAAAGQGGGGASVVVFDASNSPPDSKHRPSKQSTKR